MLPMDPSNSLPPLGPDPGLGVTNSASSQPSSTSRLHSKKPSQIDVPSHATLNNTPQDPKRSTPPVRRKPLPQSSISPNSARKPTFSSGGTVLALGVDDENSQFTDRPVPTPWHQPTPGSAPRSASPQLVVRDLDQYPHGLSPNIPQSPGFTPFHKLPPDQARDILQSLDTENYSPSTLSHARNSVPPQSPVTARPTRPFHYVQRSVTMPTKNAPAQSQTSSQNAKNPLIPQRQNSSASSKISSFFGWRAANNNNVPSSPIAETSPTTISERSSIAGSPVGTHGTSLSNFPATSKPVLPAIDVPRANAPVSSIFSGSSFPQAPPTPALSIQVEEMEEELRDLSEELACSIRREMELEDQVERLQIEGPHALDHDKRTSDYYSDSGASASARDQENLNGDEEAKKSKRHSEQVKAQMKAEVSQKVQDERCKRKPLEDRIKSLEAHIQMLESQGGGGGSERIQELQSALEDSRRRLVEERKQVSNYEDLIAALRVDFEQQKNERDNLRDEIVPQLRARLEGLEADSAEYQKMGYENSRMQQEIQAMKGGRFGSIAEEGNQEPSTPKMGLSRSTSLMRGSNPVTISRSNSVSSKKTPLDLLVAERVKEIEGQRDALHQAVKSLLDRQKFQIREHEKRVKLLEMERDRAMEASSPRRKGYEKEVKDLRYEINALRQRAEDALEQKGQCEKGLVGLKMDLDRAEQETSGLRQVLIEKDILVPDMSALQAAKFATSGHATSATLERAYRELREAQALSIEKLRELKDIGPSSLDDAKTEETMDMLLKSMSNAEAERDFAQKQAETFRAQAESLENDKSFHEGENESLANELKSSATRVELLSSQVKRQLSANSELRERLAEAVGKGEREQKQSASRINTLQDKLRSLEDRLMIAQQHSEESLAIHEEDVRLIRKTSSSQLQRLKPPSNNSLAPPKSPLSPRSPRLDKTTSGPGMSMNEALRTEFLEHRVKELENALAEAESEMGEVVQRMNAAQIEVMELQSARDEAMRQTRSLQNRIIAENQNVNSLNQSLPR